MLIQWQGLCHIKSRDLRNSLKILAVSKKNCGTSIKITLLSNLPKPSSSTLNEWYVPKNGVSFSCRISSIETSSLKGGISVTCGGERKAFLLWYVSEQYN